jgi:hypothetical protein
MTAGGFFLCLFAVSNSRANDLRCFCRDQDRLPRFWYDLSSSPMSIISGGLTCWQLPTFALNLRLLRRLHATLCPREVLDGVRRELSLRHRPGQLRSVRRVHQCNELPDSHRRSSTQRSRMLVQPTGLRYHLPAERAGPGGSFRHERAGSQGPVLQEGCGRQSALRELSVLPSAPRVYFGLVSQLPLIATSARSVLHDSHQLRL